MRMAEILTSEYGNPSSMHQKGVEAEKLVKESRAVIAALLKVREKEIFFTSGGTESNNLAIAGAIRARKHEGKHLIISCAEHAAVREPALELKKQGYELTVLPVDETGRVLPADLLAAIREDTVLVSVMAVNNEIGSVMPVRELAGIVHEKAPKALFHVDAIQAFGKLPLSPGRDGIDALSVSGHKFHAPKGTGFLYIREGARIVPQILGGGQQEGMRSGTDNVPGICALAMAAGRTCRSMEEVNRRLYALKEQLAAGLLDLPGIFVNGPAPAEGAPQILNLSFTGIRSEVLLHALEEREIYVSAGSACSSHKKKPQGILACMGLSAERRESALRFSFAEENSKEQVDYCLFALHELVPALRRFQRR